MPGSASIDGAASPVPPQGDRREETRVLVKRDEAHSGGVENAGEATRRDRGQVHRLVQF